MVLFKSGIKGCLNDVSRFTFHYGPIQIFIVRIKSFVPTIFTFHYGPIQINKITNLYNIHSYLHSTMVLFKLFVSS